MCTRKLPELFKKVDAAANENDGDISGTDANIEHLKREEYITDEDVNKGSRLHLLKVILKWYERMLHTTLYPFGTWLSFTGSSSQLQLSCPLHT